MSYPSPDALPHTQPHSLPEPQPPSLAEPLSERILSLVQAAGAVGMTPEGLLAQLADASRSTLNRRLALLVSQGSLRVLGAGRATRYLAASPLSRAQVDAYFSLHWQSRPVARFDESLLGPEPGLSLEQAQRLTSIQALVPRLDAQFLASFVVDLSWGSSVLEGSTYSMLDTEALLLYGQRHPDKPTADAVLALNHRQAAQALWADSSLTLDNVCQWHALLTSDHGLEEVAESDHFLPEHQRGRPREYEDVNLGGSAYLPPFRPGTGFIAKSLEHIIEQANALHPVQAAVYLMLRLPYLQAFANGNKRTSRLAANALLVSQGYAPISFADMDKASYIRGMAAFYELGLVDVLTQVFVQGYVHSIVRSSVVPVAMRGAGFKVGPLAQTLAHHVLTGQRPADALACLFLR